MAEVQSKAIELNQKIIAAQHDIFAANAAQSALLQRVSDLENQIAQMKAWDEQKNRYKLINPWKGNPAIVYALRESHKDSDAAHWCAQSAMTTGDGLSFNHRRRKRASYRSIARPAKPKFILGGAGLARPNMLLIDRLADRQASWRLPMPSNLAPNADARV